MMHVLIGGEADQSGESYRPLLPHSCTGSGVTRYESRRSTECARSGHLGNVAKIQSPTRCYKTVQIRWTNLTFLSSLPYPPHRGALPRFIIRRRIHFLQALFATLRYRASFVSCQPLCAIAISFFSTIHQSKVRRLLFFPMSTAKVQEYRL